MLQSFTLTWIDVLIVLALFAVIFARTLINSLNVHKAVKVMLHPVIVLSGFVFVIITFAHF